MDITTEYVLLDRYKGNRMSDTTEEAARVG